MIELPLRGKFSHLVTQVDDDIAASLADFKLYGLQNPRNGDVYAWFRINGRYRPQSLLHRWILDAPSGVEVDHKDHKTLNNQRINIRLCTRSQNRMNSVPRKGTSKYKGVSWHVSHKKWQANVYYNGKDNFLGRFNKEYEAALAYNAFVKGHFDPNFYILNEV